jgi:hypothetical protein
MSLVVLKRKSDRFRNAKISAAASLPDASLDRRLGLGFSLNGTLRNSTGFRLLGGTTRTPFHGALPRGYGTTQGRYNTSLVSNSGSAVGINDPGVVKRSTVSDASMRALKYRWIRGGTYPRIWVKDMGTAHVKRRTQLDRILALSAKTAAFKPPNALVDGCGNSTVPVPPVPGSAQCECIQRVGQSSRVLKRIRVVIKPNPAVRTVSQGEYLAGGRIGRRECLPTPATKQHFPFTVVHNGCDTNYFTWQQAQAAGALPAGYVG